MVSYFLGVFRFEWGWFLLAKWWNVKFTILDSFGCGEFLYVFRDRSSSVTQLFCDGLVFVYEMLFMAG